MGVAPAPVEKEIASFGRESLWRHPAFLKLWIGETISLFGSQITTLALPLTAVLTLGATPSQMGLINAAGFAPFLFLTLFAGVWIDRHRRRPILIITNLGRAALLGLIPLLAFFNALRIEFLIVIVFLVGIFTVFFQLAYQSFLPTLVGREQLVEGNSKLTTSQSLADIGGPGLAGILVQLITAPIAIIVDAVSFLAAATSLLLIPALEPAPTSSRQHNNLKREIIEGFRVTFGNPYLRAFAGEAATYNFFENMLTTIYILYAIRTLHIQPGVLGLIFAIGSIGSLPGALLASRLTAWFGFGRTLLGAMMLACVAPLLLPLAHGPLLGTILLSGVAFLSGIGVTVSNIQVISLRQAVTPDHLLGRMNASYRFLTWGVIPVGAFLGGILGELIGLRATLVISVAGLTLAWLWVAGSPVPRLHHLPTGPENP